MCLHKNQNSVNTSLENFTINEFLQINGLIRPVNTGSFVIKHRITKAYVKLYNCCRGCCCQVIHVSVVCETIAPRLGYQIWLRDKKLFSVGNHFLYKWSTSLPGFLETWAGTFSSISYAEKCSDGKSLKRAVNKFAMVWYIRLKRSPVRQLNSLRNKTHQLTTSFKVEKRVWEATKNIGLP